VFAARRFPRSDKQAVLWQGCTEPPDRRRRQRLFALTHGWSAPEVLVDAVLERQQRTTGLVAESPPGALQPQLQWALKRLPARAERRRLWSSANRRLMDL
jgi:hypothetical protein